MNNSSWLSAIKKYNADDERYSVRDFLGGARELSMELKEAAKKEPRRFSDLIKKIPYTSHHTYIENILWGLAEADSPADESLTQAVMLAHQHPSKPFGRAIARLLDGYPHIAGDPKILDIIIWYALYGEATEKEEPDEYDNSREPISINKLIQRGDSLYTDGINSVRGRAWMALGSILWQVPEVEKRVWEAIDIALDKELMISVRCCMVKPLVPLFNMNKELFFVTIQRLISTPKSTQPQKSAKRLLPLVTQEGIHLFPYIFFSLPELAYDLIKELINSGDITKELIGAWLLYCESFRSNEYNNETDKLASISVDHRRLLADVTSDAIKWAENSKRAETLLKEFFFDKDDQVRTSSAKAFRDVKVKEINSFLELASVFLNSPAFINNGFHILNMFKDAACEILDLVIIATQKIIEDITVKSDQLNRHSTDLRTLQDLLKREYTSSESNPEARKKILDLIDIMLSHEIYGVDKIVTAHDRW